MTIVNILGFAAKWVIHIEVANDFIAIESKNAGLIDIPKTGWLYSDAPDTLEDNTMRVTGNNISFIFYNFVISIHTS